MCDKITNGKIEAADQDEHPGHEMGQVKSIDEINGQPPIFKLNIDCLYKVFDYLPLQDIHSCGQTCMSLQQLAGEYFQLNYITEAYINPKDIEYPGHSTKMNDFNKFVQNLLFTTMTLITRSIRKISWYAAKNYNHKLKRIRFYQVDLTGAEIRNLHNTWEYLESVAIEECTVNHKFYDQFPKLCSNLKRLYVKDFDYRRNVLRRTGNEWLLFKYPQLVHLHWTRTNNWHRIDELRIFFERNPQVRSFTIDIETLWTNRDLIIESQIKLDDLTIEMGSGEQEPQDIHHIYNLLDEFYAQGVFRRLHFNLKCFNQLTIDQMAPLHALKSLCLDYSNNHYNDAITLPQWMNLVELKVSSYCHIFNTDFVAKQLVNLERIHFQRLDRNDMLKFLCQSIRLKKMKVKNIDGGPNFNNILDLAAISAERDKLQGARKLTIYIGEEVYLATKWASGGMDFNLIGIRRETSDEWGHNYIPFY